MFRKNKNPPALAVGSINSGLSFPAWAVGSTAYPPPAGDLTLASPKKFRSSREYYLWLSTLPNPWVCRFHAEPLSAAPPPLPALLRRISGQFSRPIVVGIVPLYLLRRRINVMTLGDEEAQSLNVDTQRIRLVVIAAATLMTRGMPFCSQ